MSNEKVTELKSLAEGVSLLYVEDNEGLRQMALIREFKALEITQ